MNYYVIKYTITEYFDEVEEKHFNVSNLFTSKKEAKEHLVREGFEEKSIIFNVVLMDIGKKLILKKYQCKNKTKLIWRIFMKKGISLETLKEVIERSKFDLSTDDVMSDIDVEEFGEIVDFAEENWEEVNFIINVAISHSLNRLAIRSSFAADIE
ncbi:hypothetical protein U9W65_001615 [Staphylococcus pseudintermedius]|nr:hypothetical protein [Staphylococcus pseudintermedius]